MNLMACWNPPLAWLTDTPADTAVRVVERHWYLDPMLPMPAWLVMCVLAVGLPVIHYHSRRVQASGIARAAMASLRCIVLLMAALLLLRPTVRLHLERPVPSPLAVLVDRSGSMAVKDAGPRSPSRWQQTVEALKACPGPSDGTAERVFLFDTEVQPVELAAMKTLPPPP
ncbi:MAG TPA: hypothetical protein VLM89_02450, partial [Phycisphaerae bacterium]|nr:hypothetical protein [Phycisphaerae bacterium]